MAGYTSKPHLFMAPSWFQLSRHHVWTPSRARRWPARIWKQVRLNLGDQTIPKSEFTGPTLFIHCTHSSLRLDCVVGKFTHPLLLYKSVQLREKPRCPRKTPSGSAFCCIVFTLDDKCFMISAWNDLKWPEMRSRHMYLYLNFMDPASQSVS